MAGTSDTDFPTLNYVPYVPSNQQPSPAAATDSSGGWLGSLLGGFGQIANTGLQAYSTIQGAKLQERAGELQVQAAANQAALLKAQSSAQPWYKAAWVMPAAIVAGLVLVFALIAGRRR